MCHFLSFDCANKTMGVALIEVNLYIYHDLQAWLIDYNVDYDLNKFANLLCLLKSFIKIKTLTSCDMLEGKLVKEVPEIDRCILLKKFLTKNYPTFPYDYTIIEHQPPQKNTKSTAVSSQLAFYFSDQNPYFVDPKLKTSLQLQPKTFDMFLAEILKAKPQTDLKKAKYMARKAHSVCNMMAACKAINYDTNTLPKSKKDDAADAFNLIMVFIKREKLLFSL